MNKVKYFSIALITAVAAAVPAVGLASAPQVSSSPGELCGIQGTWVNRIVVDSSKQLPNGVESDHFSGSFTFISDATGKAIEFDGAGTGRMYLKDNGDGTYSVVTDHSGSGIRIKVPNGGMLGANYGAGHFIIEDVFVMPPGGLAAANPEVDQYVTTRESRVGGRPSPPDSGDPCVEWVAVLT
jgi:hypothetical protein